MVTVDVDSLHFGARSSNVYDLLGRVGGKFLFKKQRILTEAAIFDETSRVNNPSAAYFEGDAYDLTLD